MYPVLTFCPFFYVAFEGDGRNVERLSIGRAPPLSRQSGWSYIIHPLSISKYKFKILSHLGIYI